ncbi:MAG TPA: hypothetical protein EYN71_08505 [Flavobacteriales bacterium]|nr:hypothetical protein [Flavobacteriales bacterium]HIO68152.1 hypothetical protein [Flavobacteriales bacterium]
MVNALGTLFLSVLGLSSSFSHSQDSSSVMSFELTLEIEVTSKSITSDYLGNAYTIDDNEIAKYSAAGILISSFSDKNAGTITSVDASNPLRVQVFYQDFGQIIYLDDVLSVIGSKISLIEQGLDQATLSCSSWDDGIWLYDPQDFELKRLGSDLRLSHQSGNINQLVGIEANPNYIIEKNNFVYLNDPLTGILVFDQFGTYYKTLPVRGIDRFQVSGEQVFYLQDGKLMSYNMQTFQHANLPITSDRDALLDMRFEKELKCLTVLKEKKLEWYVIKD